MICYIKDNYNSWVFRENEMEVDYSCNPMDSKLFDGDVLDGGKLVYSPTRSQKNIPGVLILDNNRTYGRTDNKKRLYYKCKPNNPLLPHFLLPFDISIGFCKHFKNKFVTFQFVAWTEKHPIGVIQQNLGDVDNLTAFYEYQLYSRNLHIPISESITRCKQKLKENTVHHYQSLILEDEKRFGTIVRIDQPIFSIDPPGCTDRDDAISMQILKDEFEVTVYIANVWVWLEALELWDVIGTRVSTIYFPDKKRSMLPSQLEALCSLDENQEKFAIATTFRISNDWKCEASTPFQCLIRVSKNYDYDTALLKNKTMTKMMEITRNLDGTVQDTHQLIAYWMTQTNRAAALQLRREKTGIFRCVSGTHNPLLCIWEQHISGRYAAFDEQLDLAHCMLGYSEYVHSTSPIRRLVDLANQMMQVATLSLDAKRFLSAIDISKMNQDMKSIKKVQTNSNLLFQITTFPDLLEKPLKGIVIEVDAGKGTVYLEEIKWIVRVRTERFYEPSTEVECRLFLLSNEAQMYKKVRATII